MSKRFSVSTKRSSSDAVYKREAGAIGKTRVVIPSDDNEARIAIGGHDLNLTNLNKLIWPQQGISKRDLLQYYADISSVLLPHLRNRAMVIQKRIPDPQPEWVETCEILHASGSKIRFPMIQDVASLLRVVNLGCIDLNQWYATCDDVERPDCLHFDLDPSPDATFEQVLETALAVRSGLSELKIPSYPKTSGSRGIHIYVPVRRGPTQRQVWSFAKELAQNLSAGFADLITAEYRIAERPAKHVLLDYNQNAWGRTLALVYSARPRPGATVSTPVGWDEIERGIKIEDFRIDNVPERVRRSGDLFHPLLLIRRRVRLEQFL